ncbi:glycosyltransferase [Cyanobium sp. Copco_Reservoir_LC18]|nr:glycosyltransferase [Cyanobium sp. Copco_Reservoir_LC18]
MEPDRIRVIYPASRFDQPGFQVTPQRPSAAVFATQQPFLLSVGTLEPRKNQRFLVDVYQRFRERGGPAVPLVLAGGRGWLMEDFVGALKSSPWGQDIHWLGFVSEAELAWLYGHCLAMLYPSHYEGFGLPVLEAMALGAAVVSSNRTSMPEIVGDGGILLAPDDRDGWVEALEALCADSSRRLTLSSAGRRRARFFDWQRSTRQLLDLYDEALQTRAA